MATVLATKTGQGQYGFHWESRLVQSGDNYYIVEDEFCGMDTLEGGAFRPFVYGVPADRVQEILELYSKADDFVDENRPELGTFWGCFQADILPELHCHGRQSHLAWAKNWELYPATHPEGCSCGSPDCPEWQETQKMSPSKDKR